MRFCTNCGKKLDDGTRFCTGCGADVSPQQNNSDAQTGQASAQSPAPTQTPTPASTPTANIPLPERETTASAPASPTSPANPALPRKESATTPNAGSASQDALADTIAYSNANPNPNASHANDSNPGLDGLADFAVDPNNPAQAAQRSKRTKKFWIILIAAVVAVIVVISGATFSTYQAGLWGSKPVPAPSELGLTKSKKSRTFSAKDVERSLHDQGFKTTTEEAFSGQPKGSFVDYSGVKAGQQHSRRDSITIIASRGPGVPSGTQGQPVQKINQTLESMNVAVHYRKVIVATDSIKEGTVVATSPADGQPVTDNQQGIQVGVAEHTGGSDGANGVGYDVVGTPKDQAQQQYETAGFTVTMKPRFSSKKLLGKIVDSNPKPGTEADGGKLTLYYGIDANGFHDAVSQKAVYPEDNGVDPSGTAVVGAAAPVEGRYCSESGDCIDFTHDPSAGDKPGVVSSESPITSSKNKFEHHLLFCGAIQQPYCSDLDSSSPTKALYQQGSGAFELAPYEYSTGFTCGKDTFVEGDAGSACVNGQIPDQYDPATADQLSGAHYDMGPLYVYFPVGSDVSKVMDSGYFDKAEVTKAKGQTPPNTTRPFFVKRDKKLYDKTSLDITSMDTPNPFLPSYGAAESALEPVKPAPSDETAYYLVEDPQLDWDSLPEFTFSKDGKESDSAKTAKPSKNATPDQITAAAQKGDFTPIAGTYCTNAGKCVQLSKTGLLTGGASDPFIGKDSSQLRLDGDSSDWSKDSRTQKPGAPYLYFSGPDSELTCSQGSGRDACRNAATNELTGWPTSMMYVFRNADTAGWYQGNGSSLGPSFVPDANPGEAPASTSRPYLNFLSFHMNQSPKDDSVYYLQE
ncbi:PASTA domain-containing protein [Bifidobacterium sp. ESL0790]|uniref:PASTA domain-containing protein n=1 Tax=Bifidobacterium sp. ESL0790 TaxID=2983233 RepID=UPI0023F98239|nr:PASTA domain-containing protein [Bifidobacterium sp. ESL0790]WEV72407.1 PASTA domain-containing protein [Bifidobacterium sp. ESL0790]